jgi:hypothetical protein
MIPALAAARDKTKEQEALQAIADNAPPREIERMEYVSGGGETKEFKTVVHWVDGTTTILDGLVQNYAQKGYLAKLSRVDGKFAIVQAGRAHVKVKVEEAE